MKATRVRSLRANYLPSVQVRLREGSTLVDSGCQEWGGLLDRYGYGRITVICDDGSKRKPGVHRVAWIASRGPIFGDLVIDHLCRNRKCINVDHMELVTNSENTRRSDHSGKIGMVGGARNGRCSKGHEFSDDNTAIYDRPDGYSVRICISCRRERTRKHRDKVRLEAA